MSDTQHCRFSPSSAYRWVRCPASLRLIEENKNLVPSTGGNLKYAEEGTLAHKCLDQLITKGRVLEAIEAEMHDNVRWAMSLIKGLMPLRPTLNSFIYTEKKVSINSYVWGTADCLIYDAEKSLLHVIDLKYGVHEVKAYQNYQLGIYALGALATYLDKQKINNTTICLHIIQPRHMIHGRHFDSWIADKNWLEKLKQEVELISRDITAKKDFVPQIGEHCKYCPVKAICPAQQELVEQTLASITKAENDLAKIAKLLEQKEQIDAWFKSAQETLIHALENQNKVSGVRLKQGSTKLVYPKDLDDVEIIEKLKGVGFEEKEICKSTKKVLPLSVIRAIVDIGALRELGLVEELITSPKLQFGVTDELEFDVVNNNDDF